ncbi:hypothetical protein GAY28_15900, partial [Azospirillum brasilense]|nr:hypothetical protein [Azospirillum brasilense]
MPEAGHVLAIDQGTTSTRAIVFDRRGVPAAGARSGMAPYYAGDDVVGDGPRDNLGRTRSVGPVTTVHEMSSRRALRARVDATQR